MAKTLVPATFKTHIIDQLLESVVEGANTSYYAFVGDHETVATTIEEVNAPLENIKKTTNEVFRNMIFGKRMDSGDMRFVVNRHNWTANTVYQMYDDEKADLQDSNFYVVVDEDSYKHVYKCLYNNNGGASTDKPTFKDARYDADLFESGDDYYETSDGYQWKYMYSIDSTTFNKFATEKYIPIEANTTIETNAAEGAIDVIKVDLPGKNYNNYLTGKFTLADFNRVGSNFSDYGFTAASTVYKLPAGTGGAAQTTNYFQNTIIYLTSGVGVGQFKRIIRSVEIEALNGVFIELESNFTVLPDATTTYEIYPEVKVTGDGQETQEAIARAIIDPNASNSVNKVDVLQRGANYSFAIAEVLEGQPAIDINLEPINVTAATVRPILPPQGGHGANTAVEFGSKRMMFYMQYLRDESDLVEPVNSFAQFGIIRDPQFANVALYHTGDGGTFLEDEKIIQFTRLQLNGTFQSNTSLGTELLADGDYEFQKHFDVGDHVYIHQGTNHFITTIAQGTLTDRLNLAETPPFATATTVACNAYYVHVESEGIAHNVSPPLPVDAAAGMLLNNVKPEFAKGNYIYGESSKSIAEIEGVDINNRIGVYDADFRFADFNQMLKIEGFVTDGSGPASTGTFILDETVRQGTNTAQLHSVTDSGAKKIISLTNVVGSFNTNSEIVGDVSGAKLTSSNTDALDLTKGDIDPNTGSIIYLQNDIPVDRSENQSEEIRVILEF